MRKVLLATTALGMSAGVAFAQDAMEMAPPITLKGAAEMGVAGGSDTSGRFHTDIGLEFVMQGTTDGGVTFGTTVELADGDGSSRDETGGIAVHMNGPFGNLTLGDTDGAFDWALKEVDDGLAGAIGDEHRGPGRMDNAGLDGLHDGQILRYDYSVSGFSFGGSLELDDELPGSAQSATRTAEDRGSGEAVFGVGGKYEMAMGENTVGVGVGYQMGSKGATALRTTDATAGVYTDRDGDADTVEVDDYTAIGASAHVTTAYGLTMIGNYSRSEREDSRGTEGTNVYDGTLTYAGLGVGYTAGPVKLGLNVGTQDRDYGDGANGSANDNDRTGIGMAVNYDLGGGASLKFGANSWERDYPEDNDPTTASRDRDGNAWSLGVAFAF